jgi:DNA-binding transcriptional ArsR family regulator
MSTRAAAAAREAKLDAVFSALGDATRRRLLGRLAGGPATITELATPFAMTLPAVSKHVRILERAGLLRRERDGWYHRCHLDTRPLEGALAFLAAYRPFWEETLAALARHVEAPAPRATRVPQARRERTRTKTRVPQARRERTRAKTRVPQARRERTRTKTRTRR